MLEELQKKIQEKNYSLDTLMLATPYETRADRDLCGLLDEDVFNNDLYVETDKSNTKKFEEDIIKGRYIDTPYYIRASSGSGKTTYLRHFLYTNSDKISSILFDFYTATSTPMLLNDSLKNVTVNGKNVKFKYENTKYKFISVLIKQLDALINKNTLKEKYDFKDNINEKYFSYIKEISKNFKQRFCDDGECTNLLKPAKALFDIISNVKSNTDNPQQEYLNFKNSFLNKFVEIYISMQGDIKDIILFLLRLIIIFKLCKLDDISFSERNYCYVLAFDNIEHFIDDDIVFDEDILFIESALEDLIRDTENIFSCTCSAEFSKKRTIFQDNFRILLSVRDTTNFLKKQIHSCDFPISQVDITKWFDISLIHKRKYDFFGKLISEDNRDIYETMQLVLSDVTKYKNSSGRSLEEMYNNNKRRITLYLGNIFKNKAYRAEYKSIRQTADDVEVVKQHRDIFKSASRSFINRLMLDNIKKTGYFEGIFTMPSKDSNLGKGYARRILNYLNIKRGEGNMDYIGFFDLMNDVFKFPNCNDVIDDSIFSDTAKIIIKMNDHNIKSTNWCELVLVKFAQRTLDKDSLEDQLKTEYMNKCNDINYGIKISEAGVYFLDLLPKFEYYSCRYCKNSSPLFAKQNFIDKKGRMRENYKTIIEEVKEKAFLCIKEVYNNDNRFFLSGNEVNYSAMYSGNYLQKNGNDGAYGNHHIKNIFIDHIGYLDRLRGYILLFKSDQLDKKSICMYILKVIKEYIDFFLPFLNVKDNKGIFYIDNFCRNTQKDIKSYVDTISENLSKEQKKLSKEDLSYNSIFPECNPKDT